ncbi:MAG TPA: pyruvate kinase alpha/beta domain-containing protein, partial [Dehalococcoidia bacterium]|nr:pyruvate kinase alpha/beta domain-containing protein [Dehalococcoidia bacterium]
YALCREEAVARRLALLRGVSAVVAAAAPGVVQALLARRAVRDGDLVVVVGASPDGADAVTDFVRVERA